MPIHKLEDPTIQILGASQALTDPTSLVKELVDNALDAHATSIAIEISVNTLSVIQLRDNGHGIAPEDRALVARPNCTSKITTDDGIKAIQGATLGFRGQALASAAELSGSMIISTRVEGEQAAISLIMDRSGAVAEERRASHPVGTTVRITDFVAANPVREQVLLKSADKTLRKLKNLLLTYAFARPKTRLALRVIQAKSEKNNFLYAPKPDGTLEDVAMKLLGSTIATQCRASMLELNGLKFTALLPTSTADMRRMSGIGTFISVDGRPVRPKRGTLKQIVSIFRETLRAVNHASQNAKEPFLYLGISCSGSVAYDPNIEPAKDDVLFEDPDAVITTAKTLFATFYESSEIDLTEELITAVPVSMEPTVDYGVANRPILQPACSSLLNREARKTVRQPEISIRTDSRSGVHHNDSDLQSLPRKSATEIFNEIEELREVHKNVHTSNPWIIAKLNAPNRRSRTGDIENYPPLVQVAEYPPVEDLPATRTPMLTPRLASPQRSRAPFSPRPFIRQEPGFSSPTIGDASLETILQTSPSPYSANLNLRDRVSPQIRSASMPEDECAFLDRQPDVRSLKRPRRCPNTTFQDYARRETNRPFKPPVSANGDGPPLWFGRRPNGPAVTASQRSTAQPREEGLVKQGEPRDTGVAPRPFSTLRPDRDVRGFPESIDLTEDGALLTPTALGSLSNPSTKQSTNTRAVPATQEKARTNPHRPLRRKSSRFPLERIPAAQRMHNVNCPVKSSHDDIDAAMRFCTEAASFATSDRGSSQDSLMTVEPRDADCITARLRSILLQRAPRGELVDEFDQIVRKALAFHFVSPRIRGHVTTF